MTRLFDDTTRRNIAARCAAFARLPENGRMPALKRAAVAIALVETGDAHDSTALLLTLRAAGLRAHRGQWALPGGRCDEGETPVEAVLRELDEEVSLRLDATDVLGILDDYATRSGYLITPVVVWAGSEPRLRLNPKEVASVHRIPLTEIMRPDAVEFVTIPESNRRVIRVNINGSSIHAPTGALIFQFPEVLAGRATRVDDLEQPVFAWR